VSRQNIGLRPLDFDIFRIYNVNMTTKEKRRGRPRKSSGQAKSESILLRLDPAEKEAFAAAASIAGAPLSVWIRERLRLIAAKELGAASRPIPFLG
jgi:hypothetical protein